MSPGRSHPEVEGAAEEPSVRRHHDLEEGSFVAGKWTMRRRWNGDQIDYGLNFTGEPVMLKVTMGLYR